MNFSNDDIIKLRAMIKPRLSDKRYSHTLGVERAALRLAKYCAPELALEASVAALLHDVTKEIPYNRHISLLKDSGAALDESDYQSPAILHSFTAPIIIKTDFPRYATENVLSAVYNHTVGSPDMSVFDEIIFLADFIEDTRTYEASINLQSFVWKNMKDEDIEANIKILHRACAEAIDAAIINLIKHKKNINIKNILTRNALLSKI